MFRDFSFDAASRHPSCLPDDERAAMNVSPTSIPTAPPQHQQHPARLPTPPPCSMGELAQKLDQQSLRVEVDPNYLLPSFLEQPLTPPSDDDSFPTELLPLPQPQRPSYSRVSASLLRMQRQANQRMQCSPSHIKDISALVQKMVDNEEQCHICDPKSPTTSTSSASDEDEGVDMDFEPSTPDELALYKLDFRRSGERVGRCAMVSKTVRMRKKPRVMKRSSR